MTDPPKRKTVFLERATSSEDSGGPSSTRPKARARSNWPHGVRPSKDRIFMQVTDDLFRLTTADENALDSSFEGCEALRRLHGVVSVPDPPVLSIRGQPPGSPGCRPPLLRGNFIKVTHDLFRSPPRMKMLEGPALSGPRSQRVTAVTRATLHQNRIFIKAFLLLAALWLMSSGVGAQEARHALIVSSASGDAEFKEKFWTWSTRMYEILNQELRFPKEEILFLTEDPAQDPSHSIVTGKATRGELAKVIDRLADRVKTGELVFFFLLGHGSFDGDEYKFNLVGPDITGSELKAVLARFLNQQVVLVCATPCSGILTKTLSHKNRVIITATKSEFENNPTVFGEFFVEAFRNKAADIDKNSQVSFLEAFLYASRSVDAWYKDRKLLPTEHSLLEDNGDGTGSPAPGADNGEGLLAAKLSLEERPAVTAQRTGDSTTTPELNVLLTSRQEIEAALQELKYRKSSLPQSEYNERLEHLLIQLAQTNQKIKGLERSKP